jgi:hypothetical protein
MIAAVIIVALIIALILPKKKKTEKISIMATLKQVKEITHDTKIYTF